MDIDSVLEEPDQPDRNSVAGKVIEAAAESSAALMRDQGGFVTPPAVHLFMEDFATQPYAGYMFTRPFYRGADAHLAVARLGLLPSVLHATRIVLAWENADLRTGLSGLSEAGGGYENAFVAVEATFTTHTLVWQPFTLAVGPVNPRTGLPACAPELREPQIHRSCELPGPIAAAIQLWRELRDYDTDQTIDLLAAEGYRLNLAAPED